MVKVFERSCSLARKIVVPNSNPSFSSILAGIAHGDVWVNDLENPTMALVYSNPVGGYRMLGNFKNNAEYTAFMNFLEQELFEQLKASGINEFEFEADETENGAYHNVYQLYDKNTGSKFTDVLEINTLELPKLPNETDNTDLWNWLQFLKADREEEYTMLAQKSPQIQKAVGVLKELSQDERIRLLYEEREKARRDNQARIEGAYQQGESNKAIEIAKNFLKMEIPVEEIAKGTGLTKEEIEELVKEIE